MKLHDALLSALPEKIFFAVGPPRSGTTWLQNALDGHPQIACRGETTCLYFLNSTLSNSCRGYSRARPDFPLPHNTERMVFLAALVSLFNSWLRDKPGALYVGEKTPKHVRRLDLLHELIPTAKVIMMIRDGRDCATSAWHHGQRFGNAEWRRQHKTMADSIRNYVQHSWAPWIRAGQKWGAEHPELYLEVRYEDLHSDYETTMRRILDFLEIRSTDEDIAATAEGGSFARKSKGRIRGEEDSKSFYRKGVIGDWRNHFTPELLALFNEIGGDLNRRLGYGL